MKQIQNMYLLSNISMKNSRICQISFIMTVRRTQGNKKEAHTLDGRKVEFQNKTRNRSHITNTT